MPVSGREWIFLSYRRDDSSYAAGWLAEHLEAVFGEDAIFRDLHNISIGAPIEDRVKGGLGGSAVVLALIGPLWHGPLPGGRQRIDDRADWVRQELELAFSRESTLVLPILVGGATVPRREELPVGLQPLAGLAGHELRAADWSTDVGRIVERLRRVARSPRSLTRTGRLLDQESAIRTLAVHNTGRVACGLQNGVAVIWDRPGSTEPRRTEPDGASAESMGYAAGGDVLLVGFADGTLRRVSSAVGLPTGRDVLRSGRSELAALAVSERADLAAVAVGTPPRVELWRLSAGELLEQVAGLPDAVAALDWNSAGDSLLIACLDGSLLVWNEVTSATSYVASNPGDFLSAVKWSTSGKLIVTACLTDELLVFDGRSHSVRSKHEARGEQITAVGWSSDDSFLAAGTASGSLYVWERTTGDRWIEPAHDGWISAVAWVPGARELYSAGIDGSLLKWSVAA